MSARGLNESRGVGFILMGVIEALVQWGVLVDNGA